MLELKDLHKSIKGQEILKGVDLSVGKGETVVVIGRSGTGKSVLLRHIVGLMKPDRGEVRVNGTDLVPLDEESINPLRRDIGMMFQNSALFDSFTVHQNLAFPLWEEGNRDQSDIDQRVEQALEMVELGGHGHKKPSELSGGMRKRVALARAAITHPALMLYDEPTSGLDPVVSDSISKLILRFSRKWGMASIVVTHDMTSAYLIGDRIVYLREGVIYFSGTPDEVKASTDKDLQNFVNGVSEIEL